MSGQLPRKKDENKILACFVDLSQITHLGANYNLLPPFRVAQVWCGRKSGWMPV